MRSAIAATRQCSHSAPSIPVDVQWLFYQQGARRVGRERHVVRVRTSGPPTRPNLTNRRAQRRPVAPIPAAVDACARFTGRPAAPAERRSRRAPLAAAASHQATMRSSALADRATTGRGSAPVDRRATTSQWARADTTPPNRWSLRHALPPDRPSTGSRIRPIQHATCPTE